MSITNIESMVDALIDDEMIMVQSMSMEEMDNFIYNLVREKYEAMPERHIMEEYERLA